MSGARRLHLAFSRRTVRSYPGQSSYVLSSGSARCSSVGRDQPSDAVFAAIGWHAVFDSGSGMRTDARRIYAWCGEKLQVHGFSLPVPGLGNVVKDGSG